MTGSSDRTNRDERLNIVSVMCNCDEKLGNSLEYDLLIVSRLMSFLLLLYVGNSTGKSVVYTACPTMINRSSTRFPFADKCYFAYCDMSTVLWWLNDFAVSREAVYIT